MLTAKSQVIFASFIVLSCFVASGWTTRPIRGRPTDIAGRRRFKITKLAAGSVDPEVLIAMSYPHFESKTLFPSSDPHQKELCWEKCPPGETHINMKEKLLRDVQASKIKKIIMDNNVTLQAVDKLGNETKEVRGFGRRQMIVKKKMEELINDPELQQASSLPHFESKHLFPSNNPDHVNICWRKCEPNQVNMRDKLLGVTESTEKTKNRKSLASIEAERKKVALKAMRKKKRRSGSVMPDRFATKPRLKSLIVAKFYDRDNYLVYPQSRNQRRRSARSRF